MLPSRGQGWTLDHYWQWQALGDQVVAYADIVRGTDRDNLDNWRGALVRFSLREPSDLTILRLDSLDDRDRRIFFRTGNPYIATLNDTAYILSMGNRPTLYRNEKGSARLEELKGLLPGRDKSPQLPEFKTQEDYVALMAAIEKESMPVGLYGWNDSLYILSRSPGTKGTRWVLTAVDPTRRQITGSLELPIKANHVTVVPGPQSWAIIEKGPVRGYGVQDIPRILFIPSAFLRAPLKSNTRVCPM